MDTCSAGPLAHDNRGRGDADVATRPARTAPSVSDGRSRAGDAPETARPGCSGPGALVLVLAGLIAAGACDRSPEPRGFQALLGDRARTPPPSSSGRCTFDLNGEHAETVFFVLGMLDEYLGRHFVEDGDQVERFYSNETVQAAIFEQQLRRLAQEQGLSPAVREEAGGPPPHVVFRSKAIADRLNSCYRYQASGQEAVQAADGTYRRTASASLGHELFMRAGQGIVRGNGLPDEVFHRRRALAYLAGAWSRYGRGGEYVFANAHAKADLVAQLLTDIGCRGVRLESTYGYVPRTNTVRFAPTAELEAWLAREGPRRGDPDPRK